MSDLKVYHHNDPFVLESGDLIHNLKIGYHTFGKLNADKSNVVWVCHALTANSNVPEWWGKLAGPEGVLNPREHFIICANIIGSCYGSSNPLDHRPDGHRYLLDFPRFTMRDIVKAHLILKDYLGITDIFLCMGGSCGGQQVLEMALLSPDAVENIFTIASSARETAWSIAIHTTQRMAIEADCTWGSDDPKAGQDGLRTARGIGLLNYRSFSAYVETQTDTKSKLDDFKAESYIRYQGNKLVARFNAYSYWYLTKALDTHHIGRGRGKIEDVLRSIKSRSLVMGIESDVLIPFSEQRSIAEHIPDSILVNLASQYGHDGFLIEQDRIKIELEKFLNLSHGI